MEDNLRSIARGDIKVDLTMEYGLGRQNNHVRTTTTAKPGNDRIKRYSKVLKGKATTTSRGQAQVYRARWSQSIENAQPAPICRITALWPPAESRKNGVERLADIRYDVVDMLYPDG